MSVDSQLLNRNSQSSQAQAGDSADRAAQLREEKRQGVAGDNAGTEDTSGGLREQLVGQRKKRQGLKEKAMEQVAAPVNKATSKLLKSSWENLVDSFGATLIWINIHVFLGTVVGEKFFCKLGMEWIDDNIKKANVKAAEKAGRMIGVIEKPGLAMLDFGCLLIFLVVFALLYWLFDSFFVKAYIFIIDLFS